jgi:hypothetical protein
VGREEPLSGYRGNVGSVKVFVKELGATFRYVPIVRGPETNPYVKDDQVICAFLENRLEEVVILGRINRLPLERMVGINVEEPKYPVHIGGATTLHGVTLKIDPTSYTGSNRASMLFGDDTEMGGNGDPYPGDWFVHDKNADKYNLYHTGHSNTTTGGLTITSTGLSERYLKIQPAYMSGSNEFGYLNISNVQQSLLLNGALRPLGCHPWASATYNLGAVGLEWSQIYLVNNPIVSSDQNYKTDIVDSNLGLDFVNDLRPVSFKLTHTDGREGVRTHYGLIAQEVESVLGADASDTAIWTKETIEASPEVPADEGLPGLPAVEEHEKQGLRYDELIAPMIKAIQELTARIEALED